MSALHETIASQRDIMERVKEMYARFLDRDNSAKSRGYLSTLVQELDDMYQQFKYQHDEIMKSIRDSDVSEADVPYVVDKCFYEFSDQYFSFKGAIVDSMPSNTTGSPFSSTFAVSHGHADTSCSMEAKLPKISLPNFSGDYMEWFPFRDIYLSLVHNNFSLSKIQKFFYLKGTLSGEAAGLIRTLSVTEANYDTAWTILESRYHNRRMIVGSLTSRLFNVPRSDGSFGSIKALLDTTHECLSSLKNLGIDTGTWDPVLIYVICQKLDFQTRRDWEHSLRSSTELPSRDEMFSFLERTFRTLESLEDDSSNSGRIKSAKVKSRSFNAAKFTAPRSISCCYCSKNHYLSKCYQFLALSLNMKNDFLRNRNICRNCLSLGHHHDKCPSLYRCGTCNLPHHTVLHSDDTPSIQNRNESDETHITSHAAGVLHDVFLYTIRLFVETCHGRYPMRALLDPGSQGSLVSESAVQLLGVKRKRSFCKVVGVGDGNENISKYSVEIDLWSTKLKPVLTCTAFVLRNVSSYRPNTSRRISFPGICIDALADPYYYKSDPIDIILGSDVCSKIQIPTESFIHDELFFQNTHFGWVFSGSPVSVSPNVIHFHNTNLEGILRAFWEQEEIISSRQLTDEEEACEDFFLRTTTRSPDGRYCVHLPFRNILNEKPLPVMHNNLIGALSRYNQLEKSFLRRPLYAKAYRQFIREYEMLGHMSRIGYYTPSVSGNSYFLPHHGIFKEDSTTTKLRVVFDGSSHIKGHKSLNEELAPGPALQNDLPMVITRWRKHRFAFSADIEKMFRQINVCQEHRPFQQILWRANPNEDISVYQLTTVTYGTTSAPYLAIRILRKLAQDYENYFPHESSILTTDSYVDDILSGSDSVNGVISMYKNLSALLREGGFNLRKWITNCPELLREIPEEFRETSVTLNFDQDNVVKTLGVQWNIRTDTFSFRVCLNDPHPVSKRSILSDTARLYDPLGWLTPSTVIAKSLFKKLWENGVGWDDPVPPFIEHDWIKYRSALPSFSELKIPRWLNFSPHSKLELHCFSDASTIAYAAAVYVRVVTLDNVFVNLLQAKSKVTPIKTVSIPRLELCAAVLAAKLLHKVKGSFSDTSIQDVHFWSDSFTVLSWLRKPPTRWSVYVANRVAEIQRLSDPSQWRYVPSALNPADCASRGMHPSDLVENFSWWYGPNFLKLPSRYWPETLPNLETDEESKYPDIQCHLISDVEYPVLLSRYSDLRRLLRITAYCLRFVHNCRNVTKQKTGMLQHACLREALLTLIRVTQNIDFSQEIKLLVNKSEVKHKPLLRLLPFIDGTGIIRVGGRLQNSELPYDVKHPILLAKSNPLSKLIIRDAHERTLNGGITLTMSYVNRKYWVISGNQLAKRIINNCIRCFRYTARTSRQIMGNLPAVRTNMTRPFKHSGVDYAGPIYMKNSTLRSSVTTKGYICLFICMVTKALHLEAVSDMTTNSFLAAFRRFVSRRGSCTDIYSDCGTNFVGASKELRAMIHRSENSLPDDIRQNLSALGTDWHFIPPASPNFGGLWEAGVKSVKYHLKRITGDRLLSYEEFSTLLCEIESCLNSRPLCPLSSDPSDINALTPAHFLIGEPSTCIPEESLLDRNINRLSRWKKIEMLKQHFWKRWYREYINRLQARPKWLTEKKDAKIGDLVIIADERCGPAQWLLGRIQEVHPGPDGHVRVVSIWYSTDENTEAAIETPIEEQQLKDGAFLSCFYKIKLHVKSILSCECLNATKEKRHI
ncbi:uncharacterized protein LOC142231095 [Haematobia irritans]|uniref:uncharacterized protein LOC142231095 n=1 Tax=Haematobia irritans TaxID=7368 RepID=UPI003F502F5D